MKHNGHFKPGDPRINRKGRPKKSDSSSDEMRAWVTYLIEKNWPRLEAAIDEMDNKQVAYFIAQHLMKWKLPTPQDPILRLSDDDFNRLVSELETRVNLQT